MRKPHHSLLFLIRDTDGDEVEGRDQQSASLDSNDKSTEVEAAEIHNDDDKENKQGGRRAKGRVWCQKQVETKSYQELSHLLI